MWWIGILRHACATYKSAIMSIWTKRNIPSTLQNEVFLSSYNSNFAFTPSLPLWHYLHSCQSTVTWQRVQSDAVYYSPQKGHFFWFIYPRRTKGRLHVVCVQPVSPPQSVWAPTSKINHFKPLSASNFQQLFIRRLICCAVSPKGTSPFLKAQIGKQTKKNTIPILYTLQAIALLQCMTNSLSSNNKMLNSCFPNFPKWNSHSHNLKISRNKSVQPSIWCFLFECNLSITSLSLADSDLKYW